MARYEIKCADCGAGHVVSRKDGKYCAACRLLRVLLFSSRSGARKRRCRACGRPFLPMHRKDYVLCGACMPVRSDAKTAACRVCGEDRPMQDGVPVCRPCLKDPVQQPRVIAALQRGQAKRKAENQ